jgi:hypothetical protein
MKPVVSKPERCAIYTRSRSRSCRTILISGSKVTMRIGHIKGAFLTTESNQVVRPIHGKAMPVLLTKPEERDTWLDGPTEQAIALQRPLPNDLLRIVATGQKSDLSLANG